MRKKDLIYKKLLHLNYSEGIDTKTLASILNMSRSNLSHELNELYKEGKLYKSSTRPVLFFITENRVLKKESQLDLLSKNNVSLQHAVEQAKAAILYPPKGMNCLILGDTGVGKSMFAELMHNYALEMEIKSIDSPFITFNCADYANTPQLLISQLFGVKKGAYTGAETDKVGLIEQSNGGILFLDEIHRLPPEGQEALFIFLDTGKFRRLGDSEYRSSDVLIISATSEDPSSSLLNTFTRRIPIIINIPSLKDRTLDERLYLIKNFFKCESIRLNKEIYVSLNALRALLSYNCPNNIGQLKSDVQLLCAKAYSEFLTNVKHDVRIISMSLPPYIKEGLYKEKEHRVLWNKLMGEEIEFFRFSGSNDTTDQIFNNGDNTIYDFLEKKLKNSTLFLIPENTFNDESQDKVKIILIAHGESTATSIADVANNLLSENYVIPINAPIDIAPSKVLEDLRIAIKKNPTKKGYLLLVDMGSLTTFADIIRKEFNVTIKVISLVSTLHVLEATRKALLGLSLDDIYKDVLMVNSYIEIHKNIDINLLYDISANSKDAIDKEMKL